jgi:hypothetical protein
MMGIGPVEYMVVAFPGNQFKGEIAPALGDLVDNGTIRVLDLVFITKDQDGNTDPLRWTSRQGAIIPPAPPSHS